MIVLSYPEGLGVAMKLFSLRNGFWMALALTVLLGSVFDFIALRQSKITDSTGEMVVLSYQVINEANLIGQEFERLQENLQRSHSDSDSHLQLIKTHLAKLQRLTTDTPAQFAEVAHLSSLLKLDEESATFGEQQEVSVRHSLNKIYQTEEDILRDRLESDRQQNRKARIQVLVASIVDVILLGTIAIVWVLYARHRRKTEKSLRDAIQSISKANFELEQSSLSKTHLLKATAHDLRNPLGSIQGLADLISEETTHPTVTELTSIIRQVSEQTLELVNSLTDPKALATGKPSQQISEFNIVKCLEDVCHSQQPLAIKKHQKLLFQPAQSPLLVMGESSKIWDLFVNLVGNAIKFSPTGGEIQIRSYQQNDNVVIEVEDQGPGFSAEDRLKAFQKYQRLSAQPTAGEASSGLGLFLVKEIVDAHHGKIEILDARQSTGACFAVTLPRSLSSRIGFDSSPTIGI